jgi:hypothetical protein
MTIFRLTYKILGRAACREIILERPCDDLLELQVADAIFAAEFAEVDFPFGKTGARTAEEALKRFGIVDIVKTLVPPKISVASVNML